MLQEPPIPIQMLSEVRSDDEKAILDAELTVKKVVSEGGDGD